MSASEFADLHPLVFAKLTLPRAAENAAFIKDVVSEPFQGERPLRLSAVWLARLTAEQLWLRRTFTVWRSLPTFRAHSPTKESDCGCARSRGQSQRKSSDPHIRWQPTETFQRTQTRNLPEVQPSASAKAPGTTKPIHTDSSIRTIRRQRSASEATTIRQRFRRQRQRIPADTDATDKLLCIWWKRSASELRTIQTGLARTHADQLRRPKPAQL